MKKMFLCGSILLGAISFLMAQSNPFIVYPKDAQDDLLRQEWARDFSSGNAPGNEDAVDLVVDDAGNIYITGNGTNLPFQDDIFTARYSADGQLVWMDYYNGEENGDDWARRILLAPDNRAVYVVGAISDRNEDFVIIKYSLDGERLWTVPFGGTSARFQGWLADAMIDVDGNIIVLGGWSVVAIIKFNSLGERQWITYLGDESANVQAGALTCDVKGNIYWAGIVDETDSPGEAFLVAKYDREGNEVWRTQTQESRWSNGVNAIAVDAQGNVTVVGYGDIDGGQHNFITLYYDSLGRKRWHVQEGGSSGYQDEAYDVLMDEFGHIYVTGRIENWGTGLDFLTVKYDTAGNQIWRNMFHSSSGNNDTALRLKLDQHKNVFVCGFLRHSNQRNLSVIKLDSAGEQQWNSLYPGSVSSIEMGFFMDFQENLYLVGTASEDSSGDDALTIKLNPDGEIAWAVRYDKPGNSNDTAIALSFDHAGNAIVLGKTETTVANTDFLLLKYDQDGELLWRQQFEDSPGSNDKTEALAVDTDGSIFIFGESQSSGDPATRIVTMKYSPAGDHEWTARYQDAGENFAGDIAVDLTGNIVVTGSSRTLEDRHYMVTVKYDRNGNEIWLSRFSTPSYRYINSNVISIDSDGNAYIAARGARNPGVGNSTTVALTLKYTPDGQLEWLRPYVGSEGRNTFLQDMTLDRKGDVYVGAMTFVDSLGYVADLVKYDKDGREKWVQRCSEASYGSPSAIATDLSGNIVVAAGIRTGTTDELLLLKYSRNGTEIWQRSGPDPGFTKQLAVDSYGNVYVVGYTFEPGENHNFLALGYTPDGELSWQGTYNGPQNTMERAYLIAADTRGAVWVVGKTAGGKNYDDTGYITTVKYAHEDLASQPGTFNLSQNYPNPFNAGTAIRYNLQQRSEVELTIYNTLGQKVETLVSGLQPAGAYEIRWQPSGLASGTYVYRLETQDVGENGRRLVEVRKLVLLK